MMAESAVSKEPRQHGHGARRESLIDERLLPATASMVCACGRLFSQSARIFIKNPRKWFATALNQAKIKGVTRHTLRHTFAGRLVMAGVDLKTVQELMGHKTIAMTARYVHLAPTHKLRALETLVRSVSVPTGRKMASGAKTAQAARKLNSTQLN
jgi:integrase